MTRTSGVYTVAVTLRGRHILGSPFQRRFRPGPVDPTRCQLFPPCLTAEIDTIQCIKMLARDHYGNVCPEQGHRFQMKVTTVGDAVAENEVHAVSIDTPTGCEFQLLPHCPGLFQCTVVYQMLAGTNIVGEQKLSCSTTLLALTPSDYKESQDNLARHSVFYEGRQVSEGPYKNKPVWIYLSPKQVYLKAQVIKYLMYWRVFTMRVSPMSQFTLHADYPPDVVPTKHPASDLFTIAERSGNSLTIASAKRNVIFATYCHYLSSRMGETDTFEKKEEYFHGKLRDVHQASYQAERITLRIHRASGHDFIRELIKTLGRLSDQDWRRRWHICFEVAYL